MKNILKIILMAWLAASTILAQNSNQDGNSNVGKHSAEKAVRGASPWGFFAEFLWVINHLEWCIAQSKKPVVHWGASFAYHIPDGFNGSHNGWEYYFEPVSDAFYTPGDKVHGERSYPRSTNFSSLWWYHQYIENIHLLPKEERSSLKGVENHHSLYLSSQFDRFRKSDYPIGNYHLYAKEFRKMIKTQILDPYIKIKPSVQEKIDAFYDAHIKGKKTVALHLRGKHIANEVLFVPLHYFFEEANKFADQGYQFFVATDQRPLIEEAKQHLRGNVLFYECERFEKTTSPLPGVKLHPQLGEDLVIEMSLLARCDHIIHSLSNVSTAVLYFNPELDHTLLY